MNDLLLICTICSDRQTLEDAPSDSTRQNLNEDKNKSSDVKKSNEKWPPKSKYSSHNHCLNILVSCNY